MSLFSKLKSIVSPVVSAINPFAGALVSGASSFLTARAQGKQQERLTKQQNKLNLRQAEDAKLDLRELVKKSQAAGFNPLTVLQATGGAGFTGAAQVSATDFSTSSMAAAAAVQGVTDYFTQSQQRELLDAQIDLARAEAASVRDARRTIPTQATLSGMSGNSPYRPAGTKSRDATFAEDTVEIHPEDVFVATSQVTADGLTAVGLSEDGFASELAQTVSDVAKAGQLSYGYLYRELDGASFDENLALNHKALGSNRTKGRVMRVPDDRIDARANRRYVGG